MKRKVDITFEVKTTIEVDVPDVIQTDNYIVNHKKEIADIAKQNLLSEGVDHQLNWDNLLWQDHQKEEYTELGYYI